MKSLSKSRVSLILLGYSALASFLVIIFYSFSYTGVALSLAILASLVFIFKSEKSIFHKILYFLILLLSFFIFYRANEFMVFLNIVSIFFLGSVMSMPNGYLKHSFGFLHFLVSPILLFFSSIFTKSEYDINFRQFLEKESKPTREKMLEVVVSVAVSIVLLLIIIPLLASANPVFNKFLNDFFGFLYLKEFFRWFFSDNISLWIFRLIFFVFLAFFVPRLLTYTQKGQESYSLKSFNLKFINFNLPKALTGIVLLIFFLTQIQFYFSTSETLLAMGITHSQYAREVFAQLLVVALIILGLVYNDKSRNIKSQVLTLILVLEGIFLTFIALKSVYDYSFYWGFTHKRLWGFTIVFWLFGVFSFFKYKYLKDINNIIFVKGVILFSAIVLIGVNILNFDLLIYKYRKSVTHSGVDYRYLSNLSTDSGSYGEQLAALEEIIASIDKTDPAFSKYKPSGVKLLYKIENLQNKYNNIDLRAFNLSEYKQYQKIKTVNVKNYRQFLKTPPAPASLILPVER